MREDDKQKLSIFTVRQNFAIPMCKALSEKCARNDLAAQRAVHEEDQSLNWLDAVSRKTGLPQKPTRPNCATAALRTGCRSIPAARFRHSGELIGATKAPLNSPPNALRTQRRSPQLRLHESRLVLTARGTPTRLSRPIQPRQGWFASPKAPQGGILQPVRCLIAFRTSAFGDRFRCKPNFHNVIKFYRDAV
jgi:hypothetical protein